MKRLFVLGAVVVVSGAVLIGHSGCTTSSATSEPKPQVGARGGSKGISYVTPVVVKAASPSPSAKSKPKLKIVRKPGSKVVPYGSTTDFMVDVESWPAGVSSITLVAKAYQITNFYQSATAGFTVVNPLPALAVFNNGASTQYSVTITSSSGPQPVPVTPDASMAGWQILLGFSGANGTAKFGGGEIFVVNP